MLSPTQRTRKPATRHPFRTPLWEDNHPEFLRIDSTLPTDHHARWLATVVSHLDLTNLRRSYAGYGSLAYPVECLLPFVLFMYSEGILSPAQWHNRLLYDDQAKWLLRGLLPARARLYAFRDRLEPFLDDCHQQLLAWAIHEGITRASRGSLDGSFVAALASRHQLMSPGRVDRRLLLLRLLVWLEQEQPQANLARRLEELPGLLMGAALLWLELLHLGATVPGLWETLLGLLALLELLSPQGGLPGQPQLPAWVPATPKGRRRVLKRYEAAQKRLTQRLEPYQHKKKLSKKDQQAVKNLKVSLTDPEAALGYDKVGTYRPLYNVVLVQATDAPLTLAFEVLSRNNDDGLLMPMMAKTKEQLGRHLLEALVDGAFVSVGDVVWCEQEKITVYAPPSKSTAVRAEVSKAEGEKTELTREGERSQPPKTAAASAGSGTAMKEEKLPKSAFRYDATEQVYYCPEGKRLEAAYRSSEKRQSGVELPVIVHRANPKDCGQCPQQKGCTSNPKKGRVVKRYEGEEALERLQQRMSEPANQQIYKQRKQSVELGYADLKEHRGLRVFRCFGKTRARAQAGLVILASNGLNIMRALHRRLRPDQPSAPQEKVPA